MREKCKIVAAGIRRVPRDILALTVVVLASSASFGLGYLAGRDAALEPTAQGALEQTILLNEASCEASSGGGQCVLASQNGTKYYLSSCAGADRISDANKIWFVSAAAARAAGYEPAANCDGL